jgi:bacterial/archaeal transporter family-2 protein
MLFLGITSAVVVGMLVAGQSKVNSSLAAALGGGFEAGVEAALISFGVGLVILCLLVAPVPTWRAGAARVIAAWRGAQPGLTRWQVLGGLSGAFFVASQGLAVATIGVALFVVGIVAGQTTGALVVDHLGVGPAGRRPATPQRVLGAGLAVVAVVLGVIAKLHGASALHGPAILLLILPLLAGAGASWQQAVNGRVARVGGSMPATWVNFVVGTAALAVVLLAATVLGGSPTGLPSPADGTWWLYLGGPIGIAFICLSAWLVHHLGVLLLGLSSVVGQVFGALILDAVAGVHLGLLTFVGAALTLVGVGVAAVTRNPLSGHRTDPRSAAPRA